MRLVSAPSSPVAFEVPDTRIVVDSGEIAANCGGFTLEHDARTAMLTLCRPSVGLRDAQPNALLASLRSAG